MSRYLRLFTASFFIFSFLSQSAIAAVIVFSDNFNDSSIGPQWSTVGEWTQSGGGLWINSRNARYTDDFSHDLSQWHNLISGWHISNENLTNSGNNNIIRYDHSTAITDVEAFNYTFDVYRKDWSSPHYINVNINYTDFNNNLHIKLSHTNIELLKRVGGTYSVSGTVTYSVPGGISSDMWNTVRLEMYHNNYTLLVHVNHIHMRTFVLDSAYYSGSHMSFWSINGIYYIDNVILETNSLSASNTYAYVSDPINQQIVEAETNFTEAAGVIARVVDAGNFYLAELTSDSFQLLKAVAHTLYLIQTVPHSTVRNDTYIIRLEADGYALRAYINDTLYISTVDASHTTGGAGVWASRYDAYFNWFIFSDNAKEITPPGNDLNTTRFKVRIWDHDGKALQFEDYIVEWYDNTTDTWRRMEYDYVVVPNNNTEFIKFQLKTWDHVIYHRITPRIESYTVFIDFVFSAKAPINLTREDGLLQIVYLLRESVWMQTMILIILPLTTLIGFMWRYEDRKRIEEIRRRV